MTEEQQKVAAFIAGKKIARGLGTIEAPSSMAAINLALYGQMTIEPPRLVSRVTACFMNTIEAAMPEWIRNSAEWRRLIPLVVGTGQSREVARLHLILDWMWDQVLPLGQTLADFRGRGWAWREMLSARTAESAAAAMRATDIAEPSLATVAVFAASAMRRSAIPSELGHSADTAAWVAMLLTRRHPDAWVKLDPARLLARLIDCEKELGSDE